MQRDFLFEFVRAHVRRPQGGFFNGDVHFGLLFQDISEW
jgi:hypothetical protein